MIKRYKVESTPSTRKINCFQYDLALRTPLEDVAYWVVDRMDPILNAGNIQAYVYSEGKDCQSGVNAVMQAYKDRPLTRQIFALVLGLKSEFKIVITDQFGRANSAQYSSQTDTLLISHSLIHPVVLGINSMHPRNIIRQQFMGIFIDLFTQHYGSIATIPNFYKIALDEFQTVKTRLQHTENEILLTINTDVIDLHDLVNRINMIQHELYAHHKSPDEVQVKLIFMHLIQYFPEDTLARYFPFFHNHIKEMVARFDGAKLTRHPAIFTQENNDYFDLVQNAECFVFGADITTAEVKELGTKINNAIIHQDQTYIKEKISQFAQENWKCAVNRLKAKHPTAYGRIHLIMAKCYHFQEDHHAANQHFRKAWAQKVVFTVEEIQAHYESAAAVGYMQGSLRRAYNATADDRDDEKPSPKLGL